VRDKNDLDSTPDLNSPIQRRIIVTSYEKKIEDTLPMHDSETAERFANFERALITFLTEKENRGEVDTGNRPVLADG
jgi:hypothetical protein